MCSCFTGIGLPQCGHTLVTGTRVSCVSVAVKAMPTRFDETSMLYINTATSPPSYAFVLQAHADLRIDCPNTPTMTIPAASLLTIDGAGARTDRGGIVDNKVTPGGRYSYAFNPGSPP